MFLRRFVKTSSPLRYARNDDPIDFIYSYVVKSLFKEQPRFDVIIVTRFSRLVNPCLQRYERLDSILRYLSRVYTEGAEDRNGALGPRKPARIPPPRFIRGNEPLEEIGFPIKLYLDSNIQTDVGDVGVEKYPESDEEEEKTLLSPGTKGRNDSRIISRRRGRLGNNGATGFFLPVSFGRLDVDRYGNKCHGTSGGARASFLRTSLRWNSWRLLRKYEIFIPLACRNRIRYKFNSYATFPSAVSLHVMEKFLVLLVLT